jgi:uncharacterized repeat protein (TIGR02543 family)
LIINNLSYGDTEGLNLMVMKRYLFTLFFALTALLFSACSSSDSGGGGGGGGLTDAAAPSISVQPSGGVYDQYASAVLSVTAASPDGGTLSYQWFSNTTASNSGGTAITSATAATFAVPTDTAGTFYYYVVVTNTNTDATGNQAATAASSAVTVTVNGSSIINAQTPVISVQPESNAYLVGDSVILSVTASVTDGGTLTYRWYSNTSASASGGSLVAQTPTYMVPTSSAGTTYYYAVVLNTNNAVNGSHTATATSDAATITVSVITNAAAPTILAQPQNLVRDQNVAAILNVTASAADTGTLSYQWFSNATASNSGGTPIDSATANTYAVDTSAAGIFYYYVIVTNTNTAVNGTQTATATSNTATVTVNGIVYTDAQTPLLSPLTSAAYPQNDVASLSVTASVTDGGTLTYQWFSNLSNSASGGTPILSATTDTYTPVPTDTLGTFYYYVTVTNTNTAVNGTQTATATSTVAVITVTTMSVLYTANFYVNGALTDVIPVAAAGNIILSATPAAIGGYNFDGWYVDNAGSSFAAASTYNLAADTEFYAKWNPSGAPTAKVKAVFYDDGIEVANVEEFPVNYITLPAAARNGYTFNGWKAEGSGAAAEPIHIVTVNTKFNTDFELEMPFTEINSKSDLEAVRANSTSLSGRYKIMQEIDLGGSWIPIGASSSAPFTGILEGNGQTVKGLYLTSSANVGLFGYISGGARIANLTVTVTGNGITGAGNPTGGIAGYAVGTAGNPTKIVNAHVKKAAGTTPKITGGMTGGILGQAYGYVTISGCSNEVPLEGRNSTGGILGSTRLATGPNAIYNSSNSATVTSQNEGGGIAGNLYNTTQINTVVNSHNTGNVSVTLASSAYAGGITGYGGMISASSNTGNISASGNDEDNSQYNGYAGGISGYAIVPAAAPSCISESYNTGTVSASPRFPDYFFNAHIGGIAGHQDASCSIENNYNTGNIAATAGYSPAYVGGIAGYQAGKVSANYNTGNVNATSPYNMGIYAAGIVGYRFGTPEVSDNAAANSSVTGTTTNATKKLNRVVGGGNAASDANLTAITGNIALVGMTGSVAFEDNAYKGTDKTEGDLKTQGTYESLGWLFGSDSDHPWTMPQPDGSDYPRLYWE